MTDVSESLQKLILETIDRDGSISDTRAFGTAYDQQQILGVLKRLEVHQVSLIVFAASWSQSLSHVFPFHFRPP